MKNILRGLHACALASFVAPVLAQDSTTQNNPLIDRHPPVAARDERSNPSGSADAVGGGLPASRPADPPSLRESARTIALDEVIVTGSRLKRREEGPAPVVVFDRQKIDQLGVSNVADVFNYLPQQSFAVREDTSFLGARSIQLRGLGVGSTLVLINGRRTVTSALNGSQNFFDLNTIPLAAVERIEVLSDSASAVYGADAIGGVVNFVLKSAIELPSVDLYYGAADGGADERRASLSAGYSQGRFRSSAVFDYFDREFLIGEERERFADADFRRFGGVDRRSPFSNPGNVSSVTPANLPGLPSRIAAVPENSTGTDLTPEDFLPTAGLTNLESLNRFSSIVPETQRASAFVSAELDLTERTTGFGELLYMDRENKGQALPATLVNRVVPSTNPFNTFGVDVAVNYLFDGVGPRHTIAEADSLRAVGGLRGMTRDWDWELSVMSTDEDGTSRVINNLDAQRINAALAETDPALALNVFKAGPAASAEVLSSLIAAPVVNAYSSSALQAGGFLRRALLSLPAGELEFVIGGESRREKIHFESKPFVVMSADRRSSAAFSEVRVPLVAPQMSVPFIAQSALTIAGRYDHYDDFGGAFNTQYGLEWRPVRQLLVRASYGTSFRAPSLFELYQPSLTIATIASDPRRNNEIVPVSALLGGNLALGAEEADSLTLGLVATWDEMSGLRVGVSYWKVDQSLRVQRPNLGVILANESHFPGRIVRDAPTPGDVAAGLPGALRSIDSTNLNSGSLETSGLDIEASASFDTLLGRFVPSVTATWVDSFRTEDFPSTPAQERVGLGSAFGTVPDWRVTTGLSWIFGSTTLSANARYVAAYDDTNFLGIRNGREVPSQTLIDAQAVIDFGKNDASEGFLSGWVLRTGVANLLDEAPSYSEVGTLGYDPTQGDLRQRYGYLFLSKTF